MKKVIMTFIFAALVSTTASAAAGKAPSTMDKIKQQAAAAGQGMESFSKKAANSSAGNMGKSALNSLKGLRKSASNAVSNLHKKKVD